MLIAVIKRLRGDQASPRYSSDDNLHDRRRHLSRSFLGLYSALRNFARCARRVALTRMLRLHSGAFNRTAGSGGRAAIA